MPGSPNDQRGAGHPEAMGGSLGPSETPGGGLTMVLTLPAA